MKPMSDIKVYGFDDSIRAGKYPMAVDISNCDSNISGGVIKRGRAPMGTAHDQFLTGIVVQFDLTFSLKAWTEAERYHFLDFVSSQSTMHRITRFDIPKQVNPWVTQESVDHLQALVDAYNADPNPHNYLTVLYNIPTGFQLTARMTTNYRQLKTIYNQRKEHRLPEWREFCRQCVDELPMFASLCLEER